MNRSETLTNIAPALVKALAKIEGVAKTKSNPGFKGSKYATLEAVIDASKDSLTECGLTIMQLAGPLVDGVLTLETLILHESGEYISGDFGIALGKQDPQGVGSAISYARRYALMAALNMPALDDDGEAAHGRREAPETAPPRSAPREVAKPTEAKAPSGTLLDRAFVFENALKQCADQEGLRRTYEAGSRLCSDLDLKEPERLAEVNKTYEALFVTLPSKAA